MTDGSATDIENECGSAASNETPAPRVSCETVSAETISTDEKPPSPTRSTCSTFWDPPCRICRVVDDEPNVLCELCVGAFHLECIKGQSLPRQPDDDEWFCRACVRRGVPEAILDRVGRHSRAFYLVKWLGRPSWDVSWEDAITLDTAWCRRLIFSWLCNDAESHAKEDRRPLLPPCHPLVDLRQTTAKQAHADEAQSAEGESPRDDATPGSASVGKHDDGAKGDGATEIHAAKSAATSVEEASTLGAKLSATSARGTGTHAQPAAGQTPFRCEASRRTPEAAEVPVATEGSVFGDSAASCERGAPDAAPRRAGEPVEACSPNGAQKASASPQTPPKVLAFSGFLCYLHSRRASLGAAAEEPDAQAALERDAAAEWRALPHSELLSLSQQAQTTLEQHWRASANERREAHQGGTRECRKRPCAVCAETDKRDAVRCGGCGAKQHLMCFFPPREEVETDWRCDACERSAPALPCIGEQVEVARGGADCAWARATVEKHVNGRFVVRRDGASEALTRSGEGVEWRRMPETAAAAAQAREVAAAVAQQQQARKQQEDEELKVDTEARRPICGNVSPWLRLVEQLYEDGLCLAGTAITPAQVEMCTTIVNDAFEHYMHSVRTLDLQEKLQQVGFMEIKMRSVGRYDLQLPELRSDAFSFLFDEAPWMGLVRAALGADAQLTHCGCMLSFPGSTAQPWHSDGPHIRCSDDSFVAPLHAVNVFVPLVNLCASLGPTEFVPGSHVDFEAKRGSLTPTPAAGHALLFDYRLKHRGLGNSGACERPLLYITYAKPFFLDVYNFDKKRYPSLPIVQQHASREERLQKRQKRLS